VSVDEALVIPKIKPGADARDIHAVGGLDRTFVVVMFHVFRLIHVVAVIDKMHTVENHRGCLRLEEPSRLEPDQLVAGFLHLEGLDGA
jgi:hypothetical protein